MSLFVYFPKNGGRRQKKPTTPQQKINKIKTKNNETSLQNTTIKLKCQQDATHQNPGFLSNALKW